MEKVVRPSTKGVEDQIQREQDAMKDFPFIDIRSNSGKRRVVRGPSRMAAMRPNKRFKSGD